MAFRIAAQRNLGPMTFLKVIMALVMLVIGFYVGDTTFDSVGGSVSYDDTGNRFHQGYVILGLNTGATNGGLLGVFSILAAVGILFSAFAKVSW